MVVPLEEDRRDRVTGTPVAREIWEQQYRSGGWDFMADEDEAGHYLAIAQFYARHLPGGSVLDIGCGPGILAACLQRHAGMDPSRYTGIDLAQEAIERASRSSPQSQFARMDYSTGCVPGTYDGVIFNETLYCFDDPVATVDKSVADNMHPGSLLIISMYGKHHERIWEAIAARYDTVDEAIVDNAAGVHWKIRVLRAAAGQRGVPNT